MIITILIGLVVGGVAWWVKNLWSMVVDQQKALGELALKLAEHYAPRAELVETFKKVFDKLDEIQRDLHMESRRQHDQR